MIKINVCENNYGYGTDEVIDTIQTEYPEVDVEVAPCLGHCEDCSVGPYVFIDDEMVQGDTPEELYEQIKLSLEKRVLKSR
ncbi:DUF1450 domain-containing protein [Crassaminicella profunda]|uniref:DUF1450 domain-containing protein n=1 Tax=Crassaminicella profunda TaxID=1286698 RepID=UPI001CA75D7A|nr:DUF1450 domain-containing protein [Crassaminicella profunda]QZY54375.1 YuzB family protein [Crassaminicella profunda]